tara:strand:- start:5030 stop:5785 length:756 start_codon:yes stop_codon:yes gene_type:complete
MGIVDVFFTPSILITLAVCLILISVLGLYFIQKINQQNHKINTMVDLVSTLSEQMGVMRGLQNREQMATMPGQMGGIDKNPDFDLQPNIPVQVSQSDELHTVNMIHVSDGEDEDSKVEYDDEEEESDEEEEDSDEEEESEDEEDSDDEVDSDDEEENDQDAIHSASQDITEPVKEEVLEIPDLNIDDIDEEKDIELEDENDSESKIKSLDVVMDYKKASLSKLRDLVQSKGLVTDASKMKKSDILKVLDSE